MLKTGLNRIDGIPVDVVRKRIRRINIRIGDDGVIHLSIPVWRATIAEGEAFLRSKWKWAVATRMKLISDSRCKRQPPTPDQLSLLNRTLEELNRRWAILIGERDVSWKLRTMKSLWGSCNFRKRLITYSTELAYAPRELVEYVVVHELTHLKVHNHGPDFYALMDERLANWKSLRRRLAKREYN